MLGPLAFRSLQKWGRVAPHQGPEPHSGAWVSGSLSLASMWPMGAVKLTHFFLIFFYQAHSFLPFPGREGGHRGPLEHRGVMLVLGWG